MDPHVAETLQLIAKAFATSPTKYSVTVAPHPTAPGVYDVLFSLPTAEAPESPAFVKLSLHERQSARSSASRSFDGLIEYQRCPIPLSIDEGAVLRGFPHDSVDLAWAQKQHVSSTPLWLQ